MTLFYLTLRPLQPYSSLFNSFRTSEGKREIEEKSKKQRTYKKKPTKREGGHREKGGGRREGRGCWVLVVGVETGIIDSLQGSSVGKWVAGAAWILCGLPELHRRPSRPPTQK